MIKDARITNEYAKSRIEQVRQRSGESTVTQTATRLVLERIAQLEMRGEFGPPPADGPNRVDLAVAG